MYADNATVLFHDKAELNTSDGASTTDNTVLTYLNNATLGFGGTAANRTVTGGTLKLAGSNTFRVNTDLNLGTATNLLLTVWQQAAVLINSTSLSVMTRPLTPTKKVALEPTAAHR